jgi:hypothetical protein
MARIRTIKPSFFRSLSMAAHPLSTRLTFIGLWTYVDDSGRGVDDARLVKAELWPLDDGMTARKVENELRRLADAGQIIRYEVEGRRYLAVTEWEQHQRINRPTPSVLPPPFDGEYDIPHGDLPSGSGAAHCAISESSGQEGNRDGEQGTEQGHPPTPFADFVRLSAVDNPAHELAHSAANPYPAVNGTNNG